MSPGVRPIGGRWIGRRVLAVTVEGLAGPAHLAAPTRPSRSTSCRARTAGDTCPVDLASTGLAPDDAGNVEVDVVEGSAPGDLGSRIGDMSGVYVECTRSMGGGGDVTAVVLAAAAEQARATIVVLAHAHRCLQLAANDLSSSEQGSVGSPRRCRRPCRRRCWCRSNVICRDHRG
jgi:hypothetical protein